MKCVLEYARRAACGVDVVALTRSVRDELSGVAGDEKIIDGVVVRARVTAEIAIRSVTQRKEIVGVNAA